jgi:hypothetical protein
MRSLSRLVLLVLALTLAASLGAPGLVSAHVRTLQAAPSPSEVASAALANGAAATIMSATPASRPLWPLTVGLALAGLTLAIVAPRRTLRVALVVLLAVFTVEIGVHSVHHLADRHAATHCAVSLASAHVQGASIESSASASWVPMSIGTVAIAEAVRPGASPLRPDEGRAPPA